MNIGSYLYGIVLITLVVGFSLAGLYVARKMIPIDKLKSHHEVGGYLLSVVGTMYAVLLGLVVVDAMTKFQTARSVVETEANSLADVFLLAERFPPENAKVIRMLCRDYAKEVVEVEWQLMIDEKIDTKARKTCVTLMREVMSVEPVTENQKAIYQVAIQEACQMWDSRRARTNLAQYGVPGVEWMVLILGGVVTVVFTYFFGLESFLAQTLMTFMVSFLISLNLYLVVLFGSPFSGDLHVGSEAFKVDQLIFENQLGMKSKDDEIKL